MSNTKDIFTLFQDTLKQLSAGAWPAFLRTAGWNYKYDFPSQVLIYAQMPEAVACADQETWQTKLHRQVPADAKGITLLSDEGNGFALHQVYDVSETLAPEGARLPLWQMTPAKEAAVQHALSETFLVPNIEPLEAHFQTVISAILADDATNLSDGVKRLQQGSDILSEMPYAQAYMQICSLLKHFAATAVMYRCGKQPQLSEEYDPFLARLQDETVTAFLGSYLQKYVRQCLDQIGKAVRDWDRQHEQEEKHEHPAKQASSDPAAAAEVELLRHPAQTLSQTKQTGGIHPSSHDRTAGNPSQKGRGGDPSPGGPDAERSAAAISAARESDFTDGLAGTHAEVEAPGRGTGISGEHLQVEQSSLAQAELDIFLTSHSFDQQALADLVRKDPSSDEAEEAVRKIIGHFRTDHTFQNGSNGSIRADNLGLHLETGVEVYSFTWSDIKDRLRLLYLDNLLDAEDPSFLAETADTLTGQRIFLPSGSAYIIRKVSQDTITLQDAENPHFTQEMPRQLLETVLENQKTDKNRKAEQLYTENRDIENDNAVFPSTVKSISLTGKSADFAQDAPFSSSVPEEIDHLFSRSFSLPAAEANYRFLSEYAPEILNGALDYIRLESDVFEPVSIERISDTQIAMAHTYLANGDLMLDPEVIFHIDSFTQRLYPLSFEQSDFGIYHRVISEGEDGEARLNAVQEQEINEFCQMWFRNLKGQGHIPVLGIKHVPSEDQEYLFTAERDLIPVEKTGIAPITDSEMKEDRGEDVFIGSNSEVHPSDTFPANETPYYGGPKTRFQNNVEAIRLLKQLEAEGRMANSDEQEILRRYVGWGGLSNAFDANQVQWQSEYQLLRDLLTEEEYASARESTLTAFYTPPVVTDAIFYGLARLGFRQGNLLDPCCGTGNFFGALPPSMQEMKLHGVELDSLSGRICRQLYQQANISITGYEHSTLPDSFYDVAVGNVPFGDYQLSDRKYDKEHFLVHDYFFAKTLDKVRPGGVIAFITSYGTMDKQNDRVRRYIAQRADLLGAVRLPNGTFQEIAGTDAGADILFLRKRNRPMIQDEPWLGLGRRFRPASKDLSLPVNQYFIDHPEMVLGDLRSSSGPFGPKLRCVKREGADLGADLRNAVEKITAQHAITLDELESPVAEIRESVPADPNIRNFSYGVIDGDLYFREDSVMYPMDLGKTVEKRVKGMIQLRDLTRELIDAQVSDESDDVISDLQKQLTLAYDAFVKKHGRLNSIANSRAFSEDASYYLLCSLENLDEEGAFLSKADMFSKRTIGAHQPATHADTPQDALALSMGELGRVDLSYMSSLCNLSEEELLSALTGMIYPVPGSKDRYELASTYLSGNIRERLEEAKTAAATDARFWDNVRALEQAMPEPLPPNLISVRLGAPWVPAEDVTQFMYELLSPDPYYQEHQLIRVVHSEYNNTWSIINRNWDKDNVRATSAYGTKHADAYRLLEDALNGRDTRIYTWDEEKTRRFVDTEATFAAQEKQRILNERFVEWLWMDPHRRDRLCKIYNDRYSCIVPPSYDGNMVSFPNMNPGITLEDHQKECVARILYGGNTLLAHEVGAGKTWTMTAAAMEGKRLGLCNKSMIVVPNHLIGQWAKAIYELYPAANVLATTEKDFEMANRKKFCSRIATGDYDIVLLGHSQLEKIPLSKARQEASIQTQIDDILAYIQELKEENAEAFTVKQMESARKKLETRLQKLHNSKQRDDVISFEELGIDRLFIDESHEFKNLFHYTKMHNVAGIAQTDAQKASDLYLKCRYMDELTGNMGNIHATGTPISNTMAEMYTNQCYLQHDLLKKMGLDHFDAWASTFGETVQVFELAPEGEGFRQRTRFARFYNVPELLNLFKLTADIRTREVLNLPVPEARYKTISVLASDAQKDYVKLFCQRAARIRKGGVNQSEDNMLCITNDGRKLALDQRLIDPSLPDNPDSKANACVGRILDYYKDGQDNRLTQLVFCDLSTPKGDGTFNVYDDLKSKLIARGIPEQEIRFIHEANNTAQKEALFSRVRAGTVRVLIGSTGKMGTGTNVQDRLIAIHDLDCPYRPSDLEQRAGRGIRRGNSNSYVDINRYVTEGTFDAYMYQLLMSKQRFISQVFTNKNPARVVTDLDDLTLSYAEIMAITSGDPKIMEKVELETEISRLQVLKNSHENEQYRLDRLLRHHLLPSIENTEKQIAAIQKDLCTASQNEHTEPQIRIPTIDGNTFESQEDAGNALLHALNGLPDNTDWRALGHLRGFVLKGARFGKQDPESLHHAMPKLALCGAANHPIDVSDNAQGIIRRLNHLLDRGLAEKCKQEEKNLNKYLRETKNAQAELGQPFPNQKALEEKLMRLAQLEKELDIDLQQAEGREGDTSRSLDQIISDARMQKTGLPLSAASRPVRFGESR